ncbi:DnaJ domain [Plasmopara halstedii]|uniref:DnaJ domain n=1 Tax=Plasmopara halstedii TaxID=4781 RepID=A0A0P1ABT7_PLAHL|nr:DnaJ domain [Plasmopara halstedii]CEG38130.1 DnaJ domain [Plasmopara halstedii]|eukprot:XP_024574499.1 DnaJ domain [Plasmopara halstedii]
MLATSWLIYLLLCLKSCIALEVLLELRLPLEQPPEHRHFLLLSGQEPVDTLEAFRVRHGQTVKWRLKMLVQICQQPQVVCRREVPVIYSMQITAPNGSLYGDLKILEGVEPADTVLRFTLKHSIGREERMIILKAVCTKPRVVCTRYKAMMHQKTVAGEGGAPIGKLYIYDDEEPVDQVYRFVRDHKLPETAIKQLLDVVCSEIGDIQCMRKIPFVYSQFVDLSNVDSSEPGRVDILQIPFGQEPVDFVYNFGLRHKLARSLRENLLSQVCDDHYVTCRRLRPIVFSSPIEIDNGTTVGVLSIQEDEELVDAVHRFTRQTNIARGLQNSLFQALCETREEILCTRGQALLWSTPVSNSSGEILGYVNIFEGQEPADVIYQFADQHNLAPRDRDVLLNKLCNPSQSTSNKEEGDEFEKEPLTCLRYAPIVFQVPVASQNGSQLGILDVLANEEPADAVARFGNKHNLGPEEKTSIVTGVCQVSGLECTRDVGILYEALFTFSDGRRERLPFYDGQDSTDVIYEYGLMRNLTLRERQKFLIDVCNEPRKRPNCTRAEPMLLNIPVWESATTKLGDVQILEGQEPVDVVYAFLEKHDLFQTAPLNTTLIEIVCNSTRVICKRMQPRRTLFSVQATYAGLSHTLEYVRPESDWICEVEPLGGQRCVHYVEILAKKFCERHMYDWAACEARILEALRQQLEFYEVRMWKGKDMYAKLGLVKTASREQIDAAYNTLVKRFNNETEPYKYEKLKEAYRVLSDPEEKYFYDLPCVKLFGCLCGKRQKDGGITFTPD